MREPAKKESAILYTMYQPIWTTKVSQDLIITILT
jgi:hypothetical protein